MTITPIPPPPACRTVCSAIVGLGSLCQEDQRSLKLDAQDLGDHLDSTLRLLPMKEAPRHLEDSLKFVDELGYHSDEEVSFLKFLFFGAVVF